MKECNESVSVVVTANGGLIYGTTPLESFYDYSYPTVTVKTVELESDSEDFGFSCSKDKFEEYDRSDVHIIDPQLYKKKKKCVICDIDGCMNFYQDVEGLLPKSMIKGIHSPVQWSNFVELGNVKINESLVLLLTSLHENGDEIIFVTARSETQRISTEDWLDSLELPFKYRLFMRPIGMNIGDAAEVKRQILCSCILPERVIKTFIEDTQSVIDMFKSLPEYANSYEHTTVIKIIN